MISGNHFTLAYVFGKHIKLGQTKINFRVDCKITLPSRKWILVSILPSNEFQDLETKREREEESKKKEHRWFAQAPTPITNPLSPPSQALAQTPITDPSSPPSQAPAQTPITDPLSQPTPPSSPIHKHPRSTSPITSHAPTSTGWAPILTTNRMPCSNIATI